jgi:hypothetical protein
VTVHGTVAGYKLDRCHCVDCRAAIRLYKKRTAVDVARHGPRVVDKTPMLHVLDYAAACGITWAEISARAGVNRRVARRTPRVNRSTRDAVLKAVDVILEERQEALDDLRSALAFVSGQHVLVADRRTWPTGPLREAIDRRWPLDDRKTGFGAAPPLPDADRRYLYRYDRLDEARADRLCGVLGLNVEDVWPTWFETEEAG